MIENMTLEDAKALLHNLADCSPRDVHRLMQPIEQQPAPPAFCQCGNCTDLGNARMNFCCSQLPCVAKLQTFSDLCLNFSTVAIAGILNYATTMKDIPNYSPKCWRNQAYRFYTLWQHAKLGRGNRRCPPSCVVSAIRKQFPEEDGNYNDYESTGELLSDDE